MNLSKRITELLGTLLGLDETQSIEGYEPSLAASWAQSAPAWLLFGCIALAVVAVLFYLRYQRNKPMGARVVLTLLRAGSMGVLLTLLAQPVLSVTVSSRMRPVLYLLFDGTDSMAIADEFADEQRSELDGAVGRKPADAKPSGNGGEVPTRADYVKALLSKQDGNLLAALQEEFRLRAFLFDGPEGVRSLDLSEDAQNGIDGKHLAEQITTDGEVTALGTALDDLARRHGSRSLAGLVVFSDFDRNAGPSAQAAAERLEVPIYTVGIGADAAVDVAVAVQAPLVMKKDERSEIVATLRQQGLDDQDVQVRLFARRLDADGTSGEPELLDEKDAVTLSAGTVDVAFPHEPDETGRFELIVEVEPVLGEVVIENNVARREVTVRDDFLRLLFVEYEPSWEWRFIKEVFHRDKLVGMEGFRTFLRSSDPRVRQTNTMFLPTMSPPRSEFFAYDVIFLGDMPASAISPTFARRTEEFVREFGGGLVVLAGPRFGPGQLADTPLGDMLPVKVDPSGTVYDRQPFRLKLTPEAPLYDFMQLGDSDRENRKAWDNLGLLPWYQPVERLHPLATALAEHPSHTCVDDKLSVDAETRQPLIAVRPYGQGEVIYIGFNETWRLRRKYGEKYYRQFWGQMIYRLGLSHALGSQKRFVVSTDRRNYQADDEVLITVEAYDANFEPLTEEKLAERFEDPKLRGELILPETADAAGEQVEPLTLSQLRKGVFETRLPVYADGEHRVRIIDPVTREATETTFKVTNVVVERQNAVRNVALQQQIADAHPDGKAYTLATVASLPADIHLERKTETSIENIQLWNTWLAFGLVVSLLLGEWLIRKWVNLP